jgi:hypothetical protein
VRTALYEAAHVILTRPIKGGALKSWAMKLARRAGMMKARSAGASLVKQTIPAILQESATPLANCAFVEAELDSRIPCSLSRPHIAG